MIIARANSVKVWLNLSAMPFCSSVYGAVIWISIPLSLHQVNSSLLMYSLLLSTWIFLGLFSQRLSRYVRCCFIFAVASFLCFRNMTLTLREQSSINEI